MNLTTKLLCNYDVIYRLLLLFNQTTAEENRISEIFIIFTVT